MRALASLWLLLSSVAAADEGVNRADPSRWLLWRCGPIPFPTLIQPQVPETLAAGPAIEFGRFGKELCIVLPDGLREDYAARALRSMASLLIHDKGRSTELCTARELGTAQREKQLLVLGTLGTNPAARDVLGDGAAEFMKGIPAGGYRIGFRPSPFAKNRSVILALGIDPEGAWAAAGILAFSVRPEKNRLGTVRGFPVKNPEGMCWAPFEASFTGQRDVATIPPMQSPAPKPPRVPFGVRLWGSPMPTLDSYQRVVRALKPLGINTIVVQQGGWPDLPDAAERCRKALDIAFGESLFTVLYAGNEMTAHHPAPLTEHLRAIVAACDSHPGLLGWHLYNQLAAKLTPEERKLLEEQTRWLSGISEKTVGHEIVWGHNATVIPDDKVELIRDCKSWGMSVIASDYAPIGGWTRNPDLSRWEGRFLNLRPFGPPAEAVIQAHVPFLDPAVPTAAEVRNQFWWALAGGARAFYFETACLYTHFSYRGILSWNLRPLSDGRYDEIRELATTAKRLETVIAESEPENPVAASFSLEPANATVALRLRKAADGRRWLLLINRSLDAKADVRVTFPAQDRVGTVVELHPEPGERAIGSDGSLNTRIPAGGGVCFELSSE